MASKNLVRLLSPKTPEAMALHYIDNLDARLEMFAAGYTTAKPLAARIFDRVRPLPGNLVKSLEKFQQAASPRPPRGQTSVTRYEHTQIGHVIIWSLLAIILIASGGLIGSSSHRGTASGRFDHPAGLPRPVLQTEDYDRRRDSLRIIWYWRDPQESGACGDCRMRARSHSLVVWLGHSSDALRLAV